MIYSYNQQSPNVLPDTIRLSSGLTRTDSSAFTLEEIADAGYVTASEPPIYNSELQHLNWTGTSWQLVDLTEQEMAVRLQKQWGGIRLKRDGIISNMEWKLTRALSQQRMGLQVNNTVVNLDTYMQALRDITDQPDPFNIIWPALSET